jgi:hypothetical protein
MTQMDVVIVPTYDRPEFLWLTLEHLSRAHGSETKEIWICEDQHADKPKDFTLQVEMLATIREAERLFGREYVKYFGMIPHRSYGNSNNLIEALRRAYGTQAPFVYIVEDDTMVTEDFFRWHEQAQKQFDPFVSCSGRINRSLNFQLNGPEAIDESCKDLLACVRSRKAYMSWATCFKRENLKYLLKHAPDAVRDEDPWQPGFEQDIFIQNFIWDTKSASVWSYVPRAFHLGWNSYHRCGMKINGTLEEKIKFLRKAITNKSTIKEMASLQEMDPFVEVKEKWSGDLYLKADYK